MQTAPCSVTAGTRAFVTRRSSRKSSVFETAVAWSSTPSSLSCPARRMLPRWMALLHAPNAAPFWNKLGFERQLQPCSISETYVNAGCTVDTTSLAGFILKLVRRWVLTCVVNDRRPSFQCTPLTTTSGPCVHSAPAALYSTRRVEPFPSCQGQRSRLPGKGSYASTKIFEENSTSAGTMRTTLTS